MIGHHFVILHVIGHHFVVLHVIGRLVEVAGGHLSLVVVVLPVENLVQKCLKFCSNHLWVKMTFKNVMLSLVAINWVNHCIGTV